MLSKASIEALEAQKQELEEKLSVQVARAAGLVNLGRANQKRLESFFAPLLADNSERAREATARVPLHVAGGWSEKDWARWDPVAATEVLSSSPRDLVTQLGRIRVGDLMEVTNQKVAFRLTAFAPFIGQYRTLIIRTGEATAALGQGLLQSLVVRTAMMTPHQSSYVLLDPAGQGRAFPMQRYLPHLQEVSDDLRRDLDGVLQDIRRIIARYLDANTTAFEKVEADLRSNERFRFVFAADFPYKYDRRAIEALQDISQSGPEAGTYVFIHHNTSRELPRDVSMGEFTNAFSIDLDEDEQHTALGLKLGVDAGRAEIGPNLQNLLFDKLRAAKPLPREILFEDHVGLPESDWWTASSERLIESPIGSAGARDNLVVTFGETSDGRTCAHGMLGAMTGSGKSNLYHVLILGLCLRYSPDELQLYLVDGKQGVEFQPYGKLPHAMVVSLHSPAELSRSVLADLIEEMEYRNTVLFKAAGPEVTDFERYRTYCDQYAGEGLPPRKIPRILLLVDEYQELFEGDRAGIASRYVLQLAQQGRSCGIHMLLGSQRFGAQGMLHQTAIFGNIHLRMALQMSMSDVQALVEFGRKGKQLIQTCDLPGKIVVNDRSGDDDGNRAGKVAFFKKSENGGDQRKELISRLITKAQEEQLDEPTIVFDGNEQPLLMDNRYIAEFLSETTTWGTPDDLQAFARRPVQQKGLGLADWHAAESPRLIWLGQEFTLRGQARMLLRRRPAENAVVVGSADTARYGMLVGMLTSLAVYGSPSSIEFLILDRSIPGTPWSTALSEVCERVLRPAGFKTSFCQEQDETQGVLDAALGELEARQQRTESELLKHPSMIVLITEPDRVAALRRPATAYEMTESPLGKKLFRLMAEGAPMGIHLVVSASGVRPLCHVVDERRGLPNFRHRVALQMAEDESLTLVRGREASRLQVNGSRPICAIYKDVESERILRFKPYSTETADFSEQLSEIGDRLGEWRQHEHG